MHISDSQVSANILTKCSKMSEVHRLHGICENGDKSFKEEFPRTSCGQGARLKFFKDGKFILELERTLEGERVSWVSVHQKTYFPPQSTASLVTPYQPDSTTSLSVSDDNSSVQSSPWQRDHMWKQNCPSRNISSELNFYYWKPKGMRFSKKSKKRRTPFSTSSDFESNYVTLESFAKIKKSEKLSLIVIIQALIDKKIQTSKQSRAEIVVSPRKRILREIEKDKLVVSDNCQKRSRGKFQSANSSFTSVGKSTITNGIEDNKLPVTRNSGYSITSLLTEDHVSKKTPNNSPNHNSPLSQPIYRSPVSEDRWYSESVDRLRSIEINHAEKCSVSPSYNPHQSFTGPYVYPFQPLRSYYGPRLYEREYMLPSIYIGSPMSLGVRSEAPSCSCSFEEDWERNKDKPLNLSKHPG